MNNENDIRWVQRFEYYKNALLRLEEAVALHTERELSDLEISGLIQRFEYTQELAWKVIKDFYYLQGESNIQGSRDAFRMAGERGLVQQSDILMKTIKGRNDVAHSYDEAKLKQVFYLIVESFLDAFIELRDALGKQMDKRR